MRVYHFSETDPRGTYLRVLSDVLDSPVIHTQEWQGMSTGHSAAHRTHELEDVSLVWDQMPRSIDDIIPAVDQSWADDHFIERVSGIPHNPAPSHLSWPYAVRGNGDHTTRDKFDHTYPERFWPKQAAYDEIPDDHGLPANRYHRGGIRFLYGDLGDVVDLLVRNPLTRQAYLPVWFPEDTGAVEAQRVPCTLGYHFMQRGGFLSCRYYIRSCDVYRHLSNDVWLAGMLTKWIATKVYEITETAPAPVVFRPGSLVMHIASLHAFTGDSRKIQDRIEEVSAKA